MNEHSPGGQGELSRSDMRDVRTALRQDWPIPATVKAQLLQRLVDYCDRESEEGQKAPARTVIAAARTLAAFCKLSLGQQALDLRRETLERGETSESTLAEAIARAEELAEQRERERERERETDQPSGPVP